MLTAIGDELKIAHDARSYKRRSAWRDFRVTLDTVRCFGAIAH